MILQLLSQLLILIGFWLLGQLMVMFLKIPIPGSVIGMILLFLLLLSGKFKLEWVEKLAAFHLRHLTILFIPLIISIYISPSIFAILNWNVVVVLIISSLCCLLGTAFSVEWFEKIKRRKKKNEFIC